MRDLMRYKIVGDNSGHEYYIPVDKTKEWRAFTDLDEDDEASWEAPEWAVRIDGTFTFTDPRCN